MLKHECQLLTLNVSALNIGFIASVVGYQLRAHKGWGAIIDKKDQIDLLTTKQR
jgi:hypothetical protein